MNSRQLSRHGVVLATEAGTAVVEVLSACSGCTKQGCLGRREVSPVAIDGLNCAPGDQVNLTVSANRLNRASFAAFGPMLALALLVPALAAGFPALLATIQPFAPAMFGCGMVGALVLGGWLGRHAAHGLGVQAAIDPAAPAVQ